MELMVVTYAESLAERWDAFVMRSAVNGTFLQTRNFLNYHPAQRFKDCSLLIMKGTNIVAVIPACETVEAGKRTFFAHKGSTFGGIVIGREFYDIAHVDAVVRTLDTWIAEQGYDKAILKLPSDVFTKLSSDLLYYFLFKSGYTHYDELSFVVDCKGLAEDTIGSFTSGKRRDYRYAEKNKLTFLELTDAGQMQLFYKILCETLSKFGNTPVHTIAELLEFKEKRLAETVRFYGVYKEDTMIAGSMVFLFSNRVFHTQYLAADPAYLHLYPMNYLDAHLIMQAKAEGFRWFSFGISTEEHGRVLNEGLARFKEGFGTVCINNETYEKDFEQ